MSERHGWGGWHRVRNTDDTYIVIGHVARVQSGGGAGHRYFAPRNGPTVCVTLRGAPTTRRTQGVDLPFPLDNGNGHMGAPSAYLAKD